MRKPREICGVNINQGHPLDRLPKLYEYIGFKIFYITPQWFLVQTAPDRYDYTWLDQTLAMLPADAEIIFVLFGPPCWIDPTFEPKKMYGNNCMIPYQSFAQADLWKRYVTEIMLRYSSRVKTYSLSCETNIRGAWIDPVSKLEGSPTEYVKNVIEPAAKIIHDYNCATICPGTTLQGEKDTSFDRACDHFFAMRPLIRNPLKLMCDHLDVHIYRDDKPQAVQTDFERLNTEAIKRTGKPLPPQECYMSEWGFNEANKHLNWFEQIIASIQGKTGQDFQVDKIKHVMAWLEGDRCPILKAIYYRGFDDPSATTVAGTNGLIDRTGVIKKSGELFKQWLAK